MVMILAGRQDSGDLPAAKTRAARRRLDGPATIPQTSATPKIEP